MGFIVTGLHPCYKDSRLNIAKFDLFLLYRRLEASDSSSEDTVIRTQCGASSQNRKTKKTIAEYNKRRRDELNNTGCDCGMGNTVIKVKLWVNITGPLAKHGVMHLHKHMVGYLNMFKNNDRTYWLTLAQNQLHRLNKKTDDIGMLSLVRAYFFAFLTQIKAHPPGKGMKKILTTASACHIENSAVLISSIHHYRSILYIRTYRPGKAYSAITAAVECIQNQYPCEWTGKIYSTQGRIYDILAHIMPAAREIYQRRAMKAYTATREHWLMELHEKIKLI